MRDKTYQTKLLRVHESILHVKARARLGKQNFMKVSPEQLFDLTTELDHARLRLEKPEAVCKIIETFRASGEFFDPDTCRALDAWNKAVKSEINP